MLNIPWMTVVMSPLRPLDAVRDDLDDVSYLL